MEHILNIKYILILRSFIEIWQWSSQLEILWNVCNENTDQHTEVFEMFVLDFILFFNIECSF